MTSLRKRSKSTRKGNREKTGSEIKSCKVGRVRFAYCGDMNPLFLICHWRAKFHTLASGKSSSGYFLKWNILFGFVCLPELLAVSLLKNRLCDSSRLYVPSSNLRLDGSWAVIIILMSLTLLPANTCFSLLNNLLELTRWRRKTKENHKMQMTLVYLLFLN